MAEEPSKRSLSQQMRHELITRFTKTPAATTSRSVAALQQHAAPALSVPEHYYRIEQFHEVEKIHASQAVARRMGIKNPFFKVHETGAGASTVIAGHTLINFSSYDYLGFSADSRVRDAAKAAIDTYGTSASASRLVAGERPVHHALESALAELYGTEACLVFVSGHATNVTTIGTLMGPKDLVIHDALIHNSVLEGIRLSGAARRSLPHNNPAALEALLAEIRGSFERVLICIEGLYSMDGDIPDLPKYIAIKNRYRALLMVDDAHSLGVLGPTGKGIAEHFTLNGSEVDLWMGTLSKTLASCGGYICGTHALIDLLKYKSGGFVYSVGLSPALAAASLKALELMQQEPQRVKRLRECSVQLLAMARAKGFDTGFAQGYAVMPIIIKSSAKAVEVSNALYEKGINIQPIIYPAVEEKNARLRFFVSTFHTEEQCATTLRHLEALV